MANFVQSNHALHTSHPTLFISSKLWLKVWRTAPSAGAGTTGTVTQGHRPGHLEAVKQQRHQDAT